MERSLKQEMVDNCAAGRMSLAAALMEIDPNHPAFKALQITKEALDNINKFSMQMEDIEEQVLIDQEFQS